MGDCGRDCGCRGEPSRRDVLKIGVTAAGVLATSRPGRAAPGDIPPSARKPAPPEWFEQLTQRGEPIVYAGEQLRSIIFPLGGIGTGSVWLNGRGRLVNWQIFNNIQKDCQVDDTFLAVRIEQEGKPAVTRALQLPRAGSFQGMRDLRFLGRYPVATLQFADPDLPAEIQLEAFNPLVPMDEKNSAIPCAVFTVRARNTSDRPMRVSFLATLQNAVGHSGAGTSNGISHPTYGGNLNRLVKDARVTAIAMTAQPGRPAELSRPVEVMVDHDDLPILDESPVAGLSLVSPGVMRITAGPKSVYWFARGDLRRLGGSILLQVPRAVREEGAVLLLSGVQNPLKRPLRPTVPADTPRRETILETFDGSSFGRWVADGRAFRSPRSGASAGQNPISGALGAGLVNTFDPNDQPQGTLTSPSFVIKEQFISFLLGGGEKPKVCGANLKIDGKVVRTATGKNAERLERVEWDVAEFADKEAVIELVDKASDPWGHVLVDDIRLSNLPIDAVTPEEADAWNEMLDRAREAAPMTAVGLGRGKVMLVPVELGGTSPGADPVLQRDRAIELIAALADAQYRPAAGRPATAPSFGSMCLATREPNASVLVGWTDRTELHRMFHATGSLDRAQTSPTQAPISAGPTGPAETVNAALCVDAPVPVGGAGEATFLMSWHFPHQYYPQNAWRASSDAAREVGNMYAGWYHDALSVAQPVLADLDALRDATYAFRAAMFDTSLPQYLVDAAAANISILRSPTCFWTKDGTFYGFEGCNPAGGGCCPMNCNHVWNYEQTLAMLWPALERNMRTTELKYHQLPSGGIHHRVEVPRDNPNKGSIPVADGQCGAVLKAYREHRQSRDRRFIDEYWPMIRKAMDFATAEWDADADGVMEKPQFNTYDRVIYGHNTFVSSLYLAALRAAEEMARIVKDNASAERYRGLYEKGRARIAAELFDGEYYIQKADNLNLGYGKGCFSDQVVGQWWARVLNLGDILPPEQVRSALKAIFKYNFLWTQEGFQGTQRFLQFADGKDKGLLIGSWPKGGRPDDPILYRDEIWTGVEYQVAAHKIYEGQLQEGLAIVRGARERYDGVKKSPWNEIECGDYYARALSSWSLLLAVQGYLHDGPARLLGFNPRLSPEDHRSFFSTSEGWGSFGQNRSEKRQVNTLRLAGGRLDAGRLLFGLPPEATQVKATARLGDRELFADTTFKDGTALIDLHAPVTVQAGETLSITLDWS